MSTIEVEHDTCDNSILYYISTLENFSHYSYKYHKAEILANCLDEP